MIQLNRSVDRIALSVAAAALGLVGCSADTATPQQQPPIVTSPQPFTPSPVTGAGGGGAVVSPVPSATPTPIKQPTSPASPLPSPAAPTPTTTPAPASTTPTPATTPAPTTKPPASTNPGGWVHPLDNWDPMAALDANGKLKVPAANDGYQMATPVFALQPGQELFKCYHVAFPATAEFPVGEWDSQMSVGSHHFILYRTAGDTVGDGQLTDNACTQGFGGTTWLYTGGSPRGHLQFPDGVAMTVGAKERITFDLHYINTTTKAIMAQVTLNANRVKAEKFQKANAQISFNFGISVPPHGTQTVGGDCQPTSGAKYFLMQTHSHKYTTKAIVNRVLAGGQMGEVLSESEDWEKPEVRIWPGEPFLTFKQGETFHYSCSYKNDTSNTITVGISAELNEMCMAEAYYFPANAPGACL